MGNLVVLKKCADCDDPQHPEGWSVVVLSRPVPQGISRMKSSSDVVGALMKELRLQSGQPESNVRLAVAVDGVNALWGRSTIKKEDRSYVRGHLKHPV